MLIVTGNFKIFAYSIPASQDRYKSKSALKFYFRNLIQFEVKSIKKIAQLHFAIITYSWLDVLPSFLHERWLF